MADEVKCKKFEGATVVECLKNASISLGVPIDKIKYSIIEEKRGLFKKHAIISIDSVDSIDDLSGKETYNKENLSNGIQNENINGTVEIKQGKIIIKNPKEAGKPAMITSSNNITVTVNDEKIISLTNVYEDSNVAVAFDDVDAKRLMSFKINEDKTQAYISITYKPKISYKLKDSEPTNSLKMELEVKEEIMPPKFTDSEIKSELINQNIKYGVLMMNVIKCAAATEISDMLIAQGKETVQGIDDMLEVKYKQVGAQEQQSEDSSKNIDYKDIGSVEGVEIGQVLAVLHPGKDGEDGMEITGRSVKAKNSKKIVLAVGEGCKIVDEYTVVATIEGRPSSKGNMFFVYKIHEINGDVEIKTGNIKFVGDIVISGNVNEGMKVEAGNCILIKQNVTDAEIIANGDIVVNGNVIHSTVAAGKEDVLTLEYLSDLNSMKDDLVKLISSISQLKDMNLLQRNTRDGELIKTLLETKFKKLPQASLRVAKRIMLQNEEDELVYIIKHKILDLGPLNIDSYEELNQAVKIIENKISILEMNLTLPVDVKLDYCQDSTVKSSGNIIFSGKGQYVSQITASDSVIFEHDKSIARGGVIQAGKEIKCKKVGGHGGVSTKLIVEANGHIWAKVAYANTKFMVGAKEYILDADSKDVHVFQDENRELIIEKLLL
ncbi:FapA family protein [Clostridium sp. CS001]|uniref:flagellar assembly protein A n=1 Tax=Clostridium sp. CS001 TaxID=2880648 RepID=UPI001CF5141D|nr:flagellar assembly protein A [Clostridium sp. CS001]MCB2288825.1 FapA family protein [Clostridium sp. CS001]